MARKQKTTSKSKSRAKKEESPLPQALQDDSIPLVEPAERTPTLGLIWFGVLFVGLMALIVLMAWSFVSAIVFGLIIAGSFYPLMRYFTERLQWSRALSASIVCFVILVALLLPTVYLAVSLAAEANQLIQKVRTEVSVAWLQDLLFSDTSTVAAFGRAAFELIGLDYNPEELQAQVVGLVAEGATTFSRGIAESINSVLGNVFIFLFQFFIMMLVIFSVLQRGPELKNFLLHLSPLPQEDEQLLIDRFNQMNYVTMVCNGVGGIIQGGLAGIGFYFAGVPSALLWTTLMVILAFIPLVGISIVYIPACIYLWVTAPWYVGTLLFIYCTIVALITENWFKPIFMGNRVQINSMLVFLSIIGGMSIFGAAGIFYGPLIVIIFLTFVQLYHEKYAKRINT